MGLSDTVSEINGDSGRKSQIFPTPIYCATLLKGLLLELGIGTWCHGRARSMMTSSAVWILCTNVTDRHWITAKTIVSK